MLHIINLLHLIKNDFYIFIRLERRKLCDFNKTTIIIHYISLTLSCLIIELLVNSYQYTPSSKKYAINFLLCH